jgi:hypothetical protein
MTRVLASAAGALVLTLAFSPAHAGGRGSRDNERNAIIQQSIYDFHRMNAERRPAFQTDQRRPVAEPRRRVR